MGTTALHVVAGQSNAVFLAQSGEFSDALADRGAGEHDLVFGEVGRSLYPSLEYTDFYPFDDGNPDTGELYRGLLDAINAELAANPDLYLAGVFWLQGEQDATSQTYGPQYETNLHELYQGLTEEFGDGFDFVISALSTHIGAADYQPAWDDVREAQENLANTHDHIHLVDPDDMIEVDGYTATEVFRDDHHYTDTGYGWLTDSYLDLFPNGANAAPQAQDDAFTTGEGTPLAGNVLADNGNGPDSDPDGHTLTVNTAPVADTAHGTLELHGDGAFSYTPDAGFNGSDSFTYEISDGHGATDTATVSISVGTANGPEAFAETGTLTLTHQAATVTLRHGYENPVVIAYVATENGAQPVNVRVSHAQGNALTLHLQEPGYLDGTHAPETVNYLVVEAGIWKLPDGTLFEAGLLESGTLSSEGFETVGFNAGFDTAPVVLSQVQSFTGGDFVTTRQDGATEDGFRVTMQEEEALNGGGHATETIGWVAIEAGSGHSGGVDWIAGHIGGVTDAGTTVDLAQTLTGGANAVVTLSSFNGADSAWVRGSGSGANGFTVSVEEEQSLNAETGHTAETADYFAFSGTDTLSGTRVPPAARPVLETGTVTLTQEATVVTLGHAFNTPVVIAFVATENGHQPVNVRVSHAEGNSLTLHLQEPGYLDGAHTGETVSYVVVEAGTWVLSDGTILEAGRLESGMLSSAGFETVNFAADFDTAPVVLSQVQSFNGGDFVTTRQDGATEDGFRVTMQEEEALNGGGHVTETIGWLAIEAGSGHADGFDWIAGHIGGVTDAGSHVVPGQGFAGGAMVAGLSSLVGADSAWVRGNGSDANGFGVSVEEEQSLDAETVHAPESVDYFAFTDAGVMLGQDYGLLL